MALPAGAATPGPARSLTPPVSPSPDPGHNTSGKSLKDSILPAVKKGGFDMGQDWILWCSSVIKVGDTYHMFASRWPAQGGIGAWTTQSECVRATSKDLLGPYTFQEVVLRKRPAPAWDKSRVHNVKIVRVPAQPGAGGGETPGAGGKDKFVLFYINTANETGYAEADSVTGPWTRCAAPVIHFSNPAPFVLPDNRVYVFGRYNPSGSPMGTAAIAGSYQGPYQLVASANTNLLTNGATLEDPTIWWAGNQYHVVATDIGAKATGVGKAGVEYRSQDGIHYDLVSKDIVFDKTVTYDDGTRETFKRRERPFVYCNEKHEVIALFTACIVDNDHGPSRVVVNPVERYYPSP
jgi:hypothetical protein